MTCTGLFAGKPAPTGIAAHLKSVLYLWERVYPRRGRYRSTPAVTPRYKLPGHDPDLAV
ncbi:hypothetical protein RK21_04471 [Pseudomonas plecoglossicida]|nr:hypothetical protein RK21_04471 [Pseudomonas plecoglossicida]